MKILLVKPRNTKIKITTQPLGLMYLSSYLKNKGYSEVKIIDMAFISKKKLLEILLDFKPDMVGLGSIISESKETHEIARIIKSYLKECFIVVGGHYPTSLPYECLKDKNIDFIICGEGEKSFFNLVDNLSKNKDTTSLNGVWIRNKDRIINNGISDLEDILDSLPKPDREGLVLKDYSKFVPHTPILYGLEYADMITSRGCPFDCVFCHNLMGKKFRSHSPERVLSEILDIKNKYDINNVEIIDDIFNFDIDRAKKILNMIIDLKINVNLYICGIRIDLLDEETINLMKKAGVKYVGCGLETGSDKLQKTIKKNLNLKKFKENTDSLYKNKIFMTAGIIFGFKEESIKTFIETLIYVVKLKMHSIMTASLRIYPGTQLATKDKDSISAKNDKGLYTDYFSSHMPLKRNIKTSVQKYLLNIFFYINPHRIYIIFRDLPEKNIRILKLLFVKFIKRILLIR